MVSIDASQWDETICDMIACQHPPCWEAMWRIEKGQPRIALRTLVSSGRESPESEYTLPTLKIIDLPFHYSNQERTSCNENVNSLSKAISSLKKARSYFSSSTINEALISTISVQSSERSSFPGLNSSMESRTPYYSPVSFTSLRQAEKLQVTDLRAFTEPGLDCQPACGNLVIKWIPNTHHRLLRPKNPAIIEGTPSGRLSVKDLALESILCMKEKKEMNMKKTNKVPTGGQPYLLHLRRNQKVLDNKSSNPTGLQMNQKEDPSMKRQCSPHHLQLAPIVKLQTEDGPSLENRRRAQTDNREKNAAPFTVQKAPSLYRFEIKSPMIERSLRRNPRKFKIASGGSELLRHPAPSIAKQLVNAALAPKISETSGQVSKREKLPSIIQLPQKAVTSWAAESTSTVTTSSLQSTKKLLHAEVIFPIPQVTTGRKRTSLKSVEYRTHLVIEGCGSPVHRISRSESLYNDYCRHLAHHKKSMLAQDGLSAHSQEQWPWEADQKSVENVLIPSPRPPPPSPLFSESSPHSTLNQT